MKAPSEPIISVIARLKRAQPRNPDTMRVCEELERRLRVTTVTRNNGQVSVTPVVSVTVRTRFR